MGRLVVTPQTISLREASGISESVTLLDPTTTSQEERLMPPLVPPSSHYGNKVAQIL